MKITIELEIEWKGQCIIDPFLDELGSVEVEPLTYYKLAPEEMEVILINHKAILLNGDDFNTVVAIMAKNR